MSITTTGSDLVASAMRLIGALAEGETATSQAMTDGLAICNRLIDGWAIQEGTILTVGRHVFPLVNNQSTYSVGPTGNFSMTRPTDIQNAGLVYLTPTPNTEWPLGKLTDDEYAVIGIKDLVSTFPTQFYYNPTMPNGSLFVWPTPNTVNNIALYTLDATSQFPDMTTSVTLPPMYARALIFNTAVDLGIEFGRTIPDGVVQIANSTQYAIKTQNLKPSELNADQMWLDQRAKWSSYNVLTNAGQ